MIRSCKKPPVYFPSVTGSICSFSSQYADLPLKSHTVAVNAVQSGTGTPSPSNPRSISGWSQIRIGQLGNSPLNSYFEGLYNGTYGFADLGSLTWYLNAAGQFYTAQTNPTGEQDLTGSNLICSDKYTGGNAYTGDTDKTICIVGESLGRIWIKDSDYSDVTSFKNSLSGVYLIYELKTPTTPTITDTQFDTLLTAFGVSGSMFTIQIGSTVYGGEYDARTGVFTVTQVKEILRGSYFSTYSASIQCAGGGKPAGWLPWLKQTGGSCEMLSHGLPTTRSNIGNISNGCFIGDTTGGNQEVIYIKFAGYSSLEDVQAFIEAQYNSNTPVEVVYELDTPQTIQLPPCLIDTLEGVNNVFADCGDTTLEYLKAGR